MIVWRERGLGVALSGMSPLWFVVYLVLIFYIVFHAPRIGCVYGGCVLWLDSFIDFLREGIC